MNRMEEYQAMLAELERPADGLDTTLERAYQRRRKKIIKMVARPVAGLAACFAAFVLLVNYCAPVSYACAKIPILRELAEAVTFSRSLSDAVENEYVQVMGLTQTENDITAEVAYLIVDQKQVNVFFRLSSDRYTQLSADPRVFREDSGPGFAVLNNSFHVKNDELRSITVDFVDGNVPDKMRLRLQVYSNDIDYSAAPENYVGEDRENLSEPREYLAEFEFLLEFDPKFTATGKIFPVNQTIVMDGQEITITDISVYPSHMRINLAEDEGNTAWLKDIDFYVETDWGMKFDPVSTGISATGSEHSPSMLSYRADSTYFYKAKHLKLFITGARWLDKDMDRTYVNLRTGETGRLPEGASLESAERQGDGWLLTFRADLREDETMYQLFGQTFYDADGNEYEINQWSSINGLEDENGNYTYFFDQFPLRDYPYDEVWLSPMYSHEWTAEDIVVVIVQ